MYPRPKISHSLSKSPPNIVFTTLFEVTKAQRLFNVMPLFLQTTLNCAHVCGGTRAFIGLTLESGVVAGIKANFQMSTLKISPQKICFFFLRQTEQSEGIYSQSAFAEV